MKKLLFTAACLLCFVLITNAQNSPKTSLKYGFGTAYLGSGDYFGRHQQIDLQHSIIKRVNLGLVGSHTRATNGSNGMAQSTIAYQGDANLYIAPIKNRLNSLKFGGGVSYRHTDKTIPVDFGVPNEDGDYIIKEEGTSLGYTALVEYELYIAKHLLMGTKASFQTYQNGDKVFFWGLNVGLRF